MPIDLSIVILNWNVADLLRGCLLSLQEAAEEWWERAEVLVVDNASTDNSLEMLERDFPGVQVIALPENRGFAAGNNAGILASQGKLIFLLNPDTAARPGSIAHLADYLQAHPTTGIVGPRLLNPDGTLQPSRRRFPTLATALIESTPLQPLFPNAGPLRRFYMLDRPEDVTQPVGWLSGAALMCRREAIMQSGLFDPGYFMFSEEVDLCRRVSNSGWHIAYLPSAEVTHYGGGSTGQDIPARHINFNTSKARYFRLHEGALDGRLVRGYLLGVYVLQLCSEAAKWLLGHKRPLRAARMGMYLRVLRSGLKEHGAQRRDRVLIVTGEFPPARGGVGDYTCRLASALDTAGVAARVLTRRVTSAEALDTGKENVTGRRLTAPLLAKRITLRAVLRALRGTGAPISHIQYQTGAYDMRPTINVLPLLLRLVRPGKTVVTFHDLLVPYLFPKAGPVREWANRLLARTAGAAIATNPADAGRLKAWGVKRVELIPIGSNIVNNPPPGYNREKWREAQGVGPDTILLAYFGFLNSSKGLDDLLGALAALQAHGDYRLMMVGGGIGSSDPTNRTTARQLSDLAGKLMLGERLIWTGYLDEREVSAALLAADMAVLPYADGASFRRGSLLAVLEHSLPLITTTPQQSAPEGSTGWTHLPALADGDNCLLVEPGSVPALTGAVLRLAGNPELRQRLSRGAGQLGAAFSWERIAQMHARLYDDLDQNG